MDSTKLQQELEHEMKRQMPLYREWERNKDSEAAFMVQALMLKAADVATSAITWKKEAGVGTAIISAYGLSVSSRRSRRSTWRKRPTIGSSGGTT